MARSALAVQAAVPAGIVPAYTAADAAGHKFPNDGRTVLHVKNAAVAPINVTFLVPGTVDGLAVASRVVAVANASEKIIGPLLPAVYNNTSGADEGQLYVDFSAVVTVTVAALRV
jgi:hypothetical protein